MQIIIYRVVPTKMSADFSKDTLQARRDWQDMLKVMKSRHLELRLFYPAKISCRRADKELPRKKEKKTKGVHYHQTIIL